MVEAKARVFSPTALGESDKAEKHQFHQPKLGRKAQCEVRLEDKKRVRIWQDCGCLSWFALINRNRCREPQDWHETKITLTLSVLRWQGRYLRITISELPQKLHIGGLPKRRLRNCRQSKKSLRFKQRKQALYRWLRKTKIASFPSRLLAKMKSAHKTCGTAWSEPN